MSLARRLLVAVLFALLCIPALAEDDVDDDAPGLPPAAGKDTGEPRARDEARVVSDADDELIDKLLDALPMSWEKPGNLLQAAIEINSSLAQAERQHQVVPWRLAEGYRASLSAGGKLVGEIDVENQPAYWQAMYMSALAAGRPVQALEASDRLGELNPREGYYALCRYWSGMLLADKEICDQAVATLAEMLPPGQDKALNPIKQQAELVGQSPALSLELDNGTTFRTRDARGKVVVFDFWMYSKREYTVAAPHVRRLHAMFAGFDDFRMIGVNLDGKQFRSIVKRYAEVQKLSWPHYFEPKGERPVSFGVFKVRAIPRQVVLGPQGKILYRGRIDDPVLYYAIRAGLRSANNDEMPRPTTRPDDADDRPAADRDRDDDSSEPPGPSKSDEEKDAQRQYRLGQTYESADLKAQAIKIYRGILAKYPDTDAAVKAKARLVVLEQFAP